MAASTPVPPTSPAPGRCGDGVCDDMEKADPDLCPEDCAGTQGSAKVPSTGIPDYEPPINVFVILHIDELGELGMKTFKPEPPMYTNTRDEIDWVMEEAARHGLHVTSLYNGWFTKMALEMNDLSQFSALLAAGHEIGSEAHQITYDEAQGLWVTHHDELSIFGRPNYDPEVARQAWADSSSRIDAVLEAIGSRAPNRIMCSTALSLSDERNLMSEFGFSIAAGNRLEASVNYLGHMSWNPWRAANSDELGYEVAEDLSSPYVSINHGAQVGGTESHDVDVTVPQLQRQFLMLYAEWLSRERTGAEDRVWSIGFVQHPNHGTRYNADLVEFLDWLDKYFIGHKSPYGNTIARYATVGEIVDEFLAWEASHPGVSSFHYVRDDPYPYTYAMLPQMLKGTDYEAHVDLGPGVSCFRFSKEGQPIYLLWSERGQRTVDLSAELRGQVRTTDARGEQSLLDATALPVTEEPTLVEPLD